MHYEQEFCESLFNKFFFLECPGYASFIMGMETFIAWKGFLFKYGWWGVGNSSYISVCKDKWILDYVPFTAYINHSIKFLFDLFHNTESGWNLCKLKNIFLAYVVDKFIQITSRLGDV